MDQDETTLEKIQAEVSISKGEMEVFAHLLAMLSPKEILKAGLELLVMLPDHEILEFIRESDNCGAYDRLKEEAGLS